MLRRFFFHSCPVLLLVTATIVCADTESVKDRNTGWHWPLKIVNGFSSNFGEYRGSHFHAGLDLRTFQQNGHKVYALADGVVEVIRRERRGTGLGVVIRHDNGYRSFVYHLEALRRDLQKILDAHVARQGTLYPGNIELKKGIRLKGGEFFAFSGETGSGFPHLHVELRNGEGDSVNPLELLHSPVADGTPPLMRSLVIRARDAALINHRDRVWTGRLVQNPGEVYSLEEPLILDGPSDWTIVAEDISDSGRPVAPYSMQFSLDGNPVIDLVFSRLKRSQNRQVGLVYDRELTRMGRYGFSLYSQSENTLYGIDPDRFEAVWNGLTPGEHEACITMSDFDGNTSTARIPFFYFPHDLVKIDMVSAAEAQFRLSGRGEFVPATLKIGFMDDGGTVLYAGSLAVNDLSEPLPFRLSELTQAAHIVGFELMKDGRRIWLDRISMETQRTDAGPPSNGWMLNRDILAVFHPRMDIGSVPLCAGEMAINPFAVRKAENGVFCLYRPTPLPDTFLGGISLSGGLTLLMASPREVSAWKMEGFGLTLEKGSVNLNRLILISTGFSCESDEFMVCSEGLALSPSHLPLLKPARVTITVSPLPDPQQLGIFASTDGERWNYVHTVQQGEGTFVTHVSSLGQKLALMRDISAPVIGSGRLHSGRAGRRFYIGVSDKGKGIDFESLTASVGQIRVPCEYDPDRRRIEVHLDRIGHGGKTIRVSLRDYAGHKASKQFLVQAP